MLISLKNIIFIFIVPFIYSYISFPLFINDRNLSSLDSPKTFIEKLKTYDIYIEVSIGSEKAKVKCYLDIYITEIMIGGEGIKNNKYNESNSESYNCSYCKIKDYYSGWYSEGIISTEDFYVYNNKNEINVVHKMNFILGKHSIYMDPPEGICGLQLPKFGSDLNYNLIYSLKIANATNSYNWFLDYNNIQNGQSKMIIDGFPHDLNRTKYNEEKFITSHAVAFDDLNRYPLWSLSFADIYYNNIKMNISSRDSKIARIQFDFGIIAAPNETSSILDEQFFGKYYNANICFKDSLSIETFIYCKNTKEFDIKKFKSIYFKNVEMNIIFELSYEELFYFSDNYIYFMIIFRKDGNWIFGEPFLKKYYLVYNQEAKTIGYYQGMEKKDNDNNNNDNNNGNNNNGNNNNGNNNNDIINQSTISLTHILLILILIGIIVIAIILYLKKGKRKNRANELEDDYEYKTQINKEKEGNRIIN